MTRLIDIPVWLLDQTLPLARCLIEDWAIRDRIREGADAELGHDAVYMGLEPTDLKEAHKAALGLREQLQRRAQGYLMALTVASSFTLGMLALLTKVHPNAPTLQFSSSTRVALLAVLISFMMSTASALRVLGPSAIYDVWLRSLLPNEVDQRKANLIRYTQLNEAYARIYAIHARSSYVGMRNGVFILFLWFVVLLIWPQWVI